MRGASGDGADLAHHPFPLEKNPYSFQSLALVIARFLSNLFFGSIYVKLLMKVAPQFWIVNYMLLLLDSPFKR
jgi:hypothetical protein